MIELLIMLAWVVGYIFVGVAILALNMFLNKKNGYEYLSSEGKYDWLEHKVIDIEPDKSEQKTR